MHLVTDVLSRVTAAASAHGVVLTGERLRAAFALATDPVAADGTVWRARLRLDLLVRGRVDAFVTERGRVYLRPLADAATREARP